MTTLIICLTVIAVASLCVSLIAYLVRVVNQWVNDDDR